MNKRITNILVVIMLLLFFPVGIILMWLITTWNKSVKWTITVIDCFITAVIILNHFISYNHTVQYFMKPNLTDAVGSLIFFLVPASAVIIAITTKKTYWIAATIIALLSVPINIYFFFAQYSCQGEFCGLGDFFALIIASTILGIVAIIVSLISAPKVIKTDKDRQARKRAFVIFLLVLLIPILSLLLYDIVSASTHVEGVIIDIQPGVDPASISPDSNTLIPVAILSAPPTFNATTAIDPATIRFGPNGATSVRVSTQNSYYGGGVSDLVLYFSGNQTGIKPGDTKGCITGKLKNGTSIEGCDTIRTTIK